MALLSHIDMTLFNPYKELSWSAKSMACEFTLKQHLLRDGFKTVYGFVESLQPKISIADADTHNSKRIDDIFRRRFAEFSSAYEYLKINNGHRRESEKRNNFWYKYIKGRAISGAASLIYFANALGMNALWGLNHMFWQWLDKTTSSDEVIRRLPSSTRHIFIKNQGTRRKPKFSFKRFQQQQIFNLYKDLNLEALMSLIIIRDSQCRKLNEQQLKIIDQHAYALYLFLFEYKYSLSKSYQLGQKICSTFYSGAEYKSDTDHMQKLENDKAFIKKLPLATNKKKNSTIDEHSSQQILNQIQHQPLHPTFKIFQ
jgi:hypothetical protein